mgnify:CR=1 FL=1
MRLTCPNCGAQYEVPDEVIPHEGRDVQCSNCGDTWFQAHPDNPEAALAVTKTPPEPEPAPEVEITAPAPREPEPQATDGDYQDDFGEDNAPDDAPDDAPVPKQPAADPGISDILRQEAEREAQLRAGDSQATLESQPDLGLDDIPGDESSRRAREARDRMARMRGQEAEVDPGSRRGLLPDIEEINSSLRASDSSALSHTAVGPARADEPAQKRGFSRGFALILIVAVVLALVYVNAGKISDAVPQVESALNAYVGTIDQARLWLDAKLSQYLPKS